MASFAEAVSYSPVSSRIATARYRGNMPLAKEIGPSFSTVAVLASKGLYYSRPFPIKTREPAPMSVLFKESLRHEVLKILINAGV
jgi:hypothetical protein